jgi:hypothetical protein
MARGVKGTDPRDVAADLMDKHIARSNRNGGLKMAPTLLEQIKMYHPDNWKEVIHEMRYEHDHPEYVTAKNAARLRFETDYFSEVPAFDRGRITQKDFVSRKLAIWKNENMK